MISCHVLAREALNFRAQSVKMVFYCCCCGCFIPKNNMPGQEMFSRGLGARKAQEKGRVQLCRSVCVCVLMFECVGVFVKLLNCHTPSALKVCWVFCALCPSDSSGQASAVWSKSSAFLPISELSFSSTKSSVLIREITFILLY